MQRTLARDPAKRPKAEKLILYIDEFAEHLAYEDPKDKQIRARPLHAKEGGYDFRPDRGITPPPSDIYSNERQIVHSMFDKSESADEWSDGEWEGPTPFPTEGNSSVQRPNRYANYQCEECRGDNRNVDPLLQAFAYILVRV